MNRERFKIEYVSGGRFKRGKRFSCSLRDFDYLFGEELVIGRYIVYFKEIDGIGVYVFITISGGDLAWRVALINGFQNRGYAHFKRLTVSINGKQIWHVQGKHTIPPRGVLTRGFHEEALYCNNIEEDRKIPEWAHAKIKQAFAEYIPNRVGPYELCGFKDGKAPGGFRVAPFSGTWWKSWEGAALHTRMMDGTTSRNRIACIDPQTALPFEVPIEYNLTRNSVVELPGFNGDLMKPDKWCRYSNLWTKPHWEGGWSSHDGEHLRRAITDAMALYDYNPWARFWLRMVHNDCRMAYTMSNVEPRDYYYKPWHDTLWHKLENTERNNACSWMGRTEAHVMMLAAFLGDYVAEWQNAIDHVVMANGMLQAVGPEIPKYPAARQDPPNLQGRITQTFESMFLAEACRRLDRQRVFCNAAEFIGTHPKWYIDVDTGERDNKNGGGPVPWYSVFTLNNFDEFGGIPGFIQLAKARNIHENPLDCLPPSEYDILVGE